MLLFTLIAPILMSVAMAEEAPIVVKAYPWAPFIARWFVRADRNRDGMLTIDEMQADADQFFARLDSNHDKQIDPQEISAYEYEIAPDVQVNSQWKRRRGEAAAKPEPDRDRPWDDSRKREDRCG